MKKFWLLLLIPQIAIAAPASQSSWTPDTATIAKLEAAIQKGDIPDWPRSRDYPNGHTPLVTDYARYYIGSMIDGHPVIRGAFLVPEGPQEKPRGVYVVDDSSRLPMVADGGCFFVTVTYDVQAARITSLACNGVG